MTPSRDSSDGTPEVILISSDEEDLKEDYNDETGHICERTTRARLGQGDPPGTSLLPTAHPLPVRATLAADPPGSPFHTRDFADPPGSPFRVPPLAPWVPPPGSPLIFPLRAHPPPLAQPSGRCSPPAQILPTAKRPRTARGYPGDPLEERAKSEEKDDSSSTTMDENVEDAAKPVVNADMELKVEKIEDDEGSFKRETQSCNADEASYVTSCDQRVSSPSTTPQCPASERATASCPPHWGVVGTVEIPFNSPSAVEMGPLVLCSNELPVVLGESPSDNSRPLTFPPDLSRHHADDLPPSGTIQSDEVDIESLRRQAKPPSLPGESPSQTVTSLSSSMRQLPQGSASDVRGAQSPSPAFSPVLAPLRELYGYSDYRQDDLSARFPTPQSRVFSNVSSLPTGSPESLSSIPSSTAASYPFPPATQRATSGTSTLVHRDQSLPSTTSDAAAQLASSRNGTVAQVAAGGGTVVLASAAVPVPAADPVVRFLHEVGLSSDLADVLRQVGISDDLRIAALGAMRVAALNQLDKTLQQAGLDFVSRVLIREGLKDRASPAKDVR